MYRRFLCLAAEVAPGIETGAAGGVVRSWECNGILRPLLALLP